MCLIIFNLFSKSLVFISGDSGWGRQRGNLYLLLWRRWKKVIFFLFNQKWNLFVFVFLIYIFVFFAELMLLGFISLLLTATSSTIANICVPSSFYNVRFVPCTRSEIKEELENESSVQRNLLTKSFFFSIFRRRKLEEGIHRATCTEVNF